jgi:hypothetical protein
LFTGVNTLGGEVEKEAATAVLWRLVLDNHPRRILDSDCAALVKDASEVDCLVKGGLNVAYKSQASRQDYRATVVGTVVHGEVLGKHGVGKQTGAPSYEEHGYIGLCDSVEDAHVGLFQSGIHGNGGVGADEVKVEIGLDCGDILHVSPYCLSQDHIWGSWYESLSHLTIDPNAKLMIGNDSLNEKSTSAIRIYSLHVPSKNDMGIVISMHTGHRSKC